MITIVLAAILIIPLVLGAGALVLLGRRPRHPTVPALVLHEVPQKSSLLSLSEYSSDQFKKLSTELAARSFITVHLRDCADKPAQTQRILLTFDDAFESVYTYAAPTLIQHKQTATIFPIAGFLGRRSNWDVYSGRSHCSKEQIRELSDWGFEIGSHSLTHPNLCWCNDRELWRELSDSKKILEDVTGKPVTSFSFPFGFWNARVWQTVLKAGYTAAAIYRGHAASQDPRLVPVYGVYKFDSIQAVFNKIDNAKRFSAARAQSRIMAHFSKGSAVLKSLSQAKSIPADT